MEIDRKFVVSEKSRKPWTLGCVSIQRRTLLRLIAFSANLR
ncbi:hypothetical protein RBSH_04618 [Rhodopirellula baltica SH28]|uniref:Uncharacterized protein n=1 Tax=Rhodopirellula baltica SH28 TaxID=993517 RepID=K5E2T2_RHOBT|nr:hypothetical protein RBSH_04618 [Rhodopirellula baltica SH28]